MYARRVKVGPKHHYYSAPSASRRITHTQPCPGSMLIASTLSPYTKMALLFLQSPRQKQRSCCLTFFFSIALEVNSPTGTRLPCPAMHCADTLDSEISFVQIYF